MQKVGDVQDTCPAESGVVWSTDQSTPFQDSANPWLLEVLPMAMQNVGEVHDTVPNAPPSVGVRLGTTVQVVPSHVSTRVKLVGVPLPTLPPTATQNVADIHDTDARSLLLAEGLGVVVMDHEGTSPSAAWAIPTIAMPTTRIATAAGVSRRRPMALAGASDEASLWPIVIRRRTLATPKSRSALRPDHMSEATP